MKKRSIISLLISISLMLLLVNMSCARQTAVDVLEEAMGMEVSGDVDVRVEEGEVIMSGDEGVEQVIGENVPADWPSVVPIHQDIVFDAVFSAEQDGKKGWSILFAEVKGSGQALYDYYKNEFSSWNVIMDDIKEKEDGAKEFNLRVSNGTYLAVVWLEDSSSGTIINLAVEEE